MNRPTTSTAIPTRALKFEALANMSASFELFCLASGMEALGEMMDHDARAICGPRHARGHDRRAHRWGKTRGKIGFHGGKVEIERPRLRSFEGKEQALPSWEAAVAEDWLGKWAMNQMLINVSTRKFARSVRLPEGDVPAPMGSGLSKSAASRRFVALSTARMKEWVASDLSGLDLLVIQIDGIHMDEDLILVAAIGVDATGDKHPLGLIEGATENAATVQALIDNLIERGLDPAMPRLFIIDGAKALSKAIRRTFGAAAAIQRCQVHKARNIMERLPKSLHASVRRVLRQAWELDDADKAEKLLRNLAQRLERDWSGVSGTRSGSADAQFCSSDSIAAACATARRCSKSKAPLQEPDASEQACGLDDRRECSPPESAPGCVPIPNQAVESSTFYSRSTPTLNFER